MRPALAYQDLLSTIREATGDRSCTGSAATSVGLKASSRPELDIPTQIRFVSNPKSILDVKIRRVNSGFMKLWSPTRLLITARIVILFRSENIEAQIAYCTAQPDGYAIGANFTQAGFIRKELRVPVDLRAMLTLPENAEPVRIRVVDMSASGVGLAVPMEIAPGTCVAVDLDNGTVFGEIRWCLKNSGFYRAGLATEQFIQTDESLDTPIASADDHEPGVLSNFKHSVLAKLRLSKSA